MVGKRRILLRQKSNSRGVNPPGTVFLQSGANAGSITFRLRMMRVEENFRSSSIAARVISNIPSSAIVFI